MECKPGPAADAGTAATPGAEADAIADTSTGTSASTTTGAKQEARSAGELSGSTAATLEGDGLRVSCLWNAQYHAAREAFLDSVHRWLMFAVIVMGAGALFDAAPKEIHLATVRIGVKESFAALAAVFAALDLTFDLSNRARGHALMKRRYFELLADFNEGKRTLVESQACLHRFSADEEPAYCSLVATSWNAAQEMVFGDNSRKYLVPWHHKMFRNFFRFGASQYELAPKSSNH